MRRGEGNPKDSRNDKKYTMQSEKRKKKLKCFEARIDSGDGTLLKLIKQFLKA